MSDGEAEFREFVAARMESLRGLAYLTCGDWQVAEDAVLAAPSKLYVKWNRIENPDAYARTAVVRAAIDETRRPWWRREQSHSHAMPDRAVPDATTGVADRLRMREALRQLPTRRGRRSPRSSASRSGSGTLGRCAHHGSSASPEPPAPPMPRR